MPTPPTVLVFVIGPTNAGKGRLLEAATKLVPGEIGLVEVGKLMRAKYLDPISLHYDPDHFKGQSNPAHTAVEAWQMATDGIAACRAAGKATILIDGQPRDPEQCDMIYEKYHRTAEFDVAYAHVHADVATRRARAERRDAGNAAKLALSEARMIGDLTGMYEVLTSLIFSKSNVITLYNSDGADMAYLARKLLFRLPNFTRVD